MSYKVKLNEFEGPFDLLVYLIETAEMNIYDIRVSEITEQYLNHIEEMKEQDVVVGAEFLVLAATLIELKSKMLLPRIRPDGEEEPDPRTDLVEKLVEYTKFKKLAGLLEDRREYAMLILEKPQEDLTPFTDEPDEYLQMDMDKFITAFSNFIYRKRKDAELRERYEMLEREKETVESKMTFITQTLGKVKNRIVKFRDLLSKDGSRYDKIVTFISLLEMVKTKTVKVRQEGNFEEIEISLEEEQQNV